VADDRDAHRDLSGRIGRRASRKLHARSQRDRGTWFGLGMYGLVGWSVVIPTLIGVGIGLWIDTRWAGRFSWTLMLLVAGLLLGCWNAWYWVSLELRAIQRGRRGTHDDAGMG
jgi:ATP synthase protein I